MSKTNGIAYNKNKKLITIEIEDISFFRISQSTNTVPIFLFFKTHKQKTPNQKSLPFSIKNII